MSSTHYLHKLFAPKSIAVVGASDRPHSIGQTVFANLLAEGGPVKLFPVNLRHRNVGGMHTASSVSELSAAPDLAVVVTPPDSYESIIRDCKKAGVRYLLLIKSSDEISAEDHRLTGRAFALAKRLGVRLLGPSFLGMIRPAVFHAATYNHSVRRGNIALIGQSSSLCSVMLNWAQSRGIGFSAVLAFGEGGTDIGFGEVLDYLVHDKATMGILLYIQNVPSGRKLMSALRAAARMKPVIVLKSGKSGQTPPEGSCHTALPVPAEEVFSSALERAGVLQMDNFSQMFTAARMLAASYRTSGSRLAVISNGAGLGLMALDATVGTIVEPAEFSEKTRKALERALPNSEVHNPLDIRANAGPLRYRTVTKLCLDDPQIDGVLVIFSPQTTDVDHFKTAQMMVQLQKETAKPLLLSWLGGSGISPARELFAQNKCLSFHAPEYAVEAFANLVQFHRNQQLLQQIAQPLRYKRLPADLQAARAVLRQAGDAGQDVLPEHSAKQFLECFHIPGNKTLYAPDAEAACAAARQLGYPVVIKIDSPDIVHKSNVGGVALNLHNARECRDAFSRIMENVRAVAPEARIDGVSIQKMLSKTRTRAVKITVTQDENFGPVIALCAGGDTLIHQDRAIALPPLSEEIIERMIRGARISQTFGGYRGMPPIDRRALVSVLSGISEMVCEFPEIRELKADVLLYPDTAAVFDARAALNLSVQAANRYAHMAIMPYPQNLEQKMTLKNGADVLIRPIRAEDAALVQNFVRNLSDESRYNRFMSSIKQLSDNVLLRFTQLDYDREIGLVMIHTAENGDETALGISRYVTDPDMEVCEFAVSVADNWQGNGIATILMHLLFQAARDQGLHTMRGEVLTTNSAMQGLVRKLGFAVRKDPEDDGITLVVKDLRLTETAASGGTTF